MNITEFVGKTVIDNSGAKVKIKNFDTPVEVGATYSVNFYPKENMDCSIDGA